MNIGYLVKRANALILGYLGQAIEARGFSFTQYVVLSCLGEGIAVNPKGISGRFRYDSGALTRVRDQLAELGFFERVRRDPGRRKVGLRLTLLGLTTIASLAHLVVKKLNRLFTDFSEMELEQLSCLVVKLNMTLQLHMDTIEAPPRRQKT